MRKQSSNQTPIVGEGLWGEVCVCVWGGGVWGRCGRRILFFFLIPDDKTQSKMIIFLGCLDFPSNQTFSDATYLGVWLRFIHGLPLT